VPYAETVLRNPPAANIVSKFLTAVLYSQLPHRSVSVARAIQLQPYCPRVLAISVNIGWLTHGHVVTFSSGQLVHSRCSTATLYQLLTSHCAGTKQPPPPVRYRCPQLYSQSHTLSTRYMALYRNVHIYCPVCVPLGTRELHIMQRVS
jgi:hypothetical protein